MLFGILFLLFWCLYTCLLTLINNEPIFIVLFAIAGLVLSIATLVILFFAVAYPILKKGGPKGRASHFVLRQFVSLIFFFSRVKVKAINEELIQRNGEAVLYVGNHKSNLDVLLVYYIVRKNVTAVAKSTLAKNPFYKMMIDSFKVVCIDREHNREAAKAIIEGIKLMKDGVSLILFPEGGVRTREVEQMTELRPGAYKLAVKSNCSIQPIAIKGSSKLSKRRFSQMFRRSLVTLEFLEPMSYDSFKDMNTTEIGFEVANRINERFDEEKVEVKIFDKL